MESDFQARAEHAAKQFLKTARKPVVIEFAGTPKAGKTSTLTQVREFLTHCGFRAEIVAERASVCPIRDKKHVNFNVWTACTTLAKILEKTQDPPRSDDPHILILDRGIFDSICWMTMMGELVRIRPADRNLIEQFLLIDDWRKRISAVILMIASPEDAIKREQEMSPAKDKEGSIMKPDVLQQIREANLECARRLNSKFRVYTINTSFGDTRDNPQRTAEMATEIVLSLIEEQIEEQILFLPRDHVTSLFKGQQWLNASDANELVSSFKNSGDFRSRRKVEDDCGLVQALPIVIVRNASGAVLRLRRREKSGDSHLHHEIVIWAGGHVRREDASNGDPILHCAMRELKEELRLNMEPESLRVIGAVYFDDSEGTAKHVAIVHEWRAETDNVAIALSSAEFFERRGASHSGKFVSLKTLAQDVQKGKITEPWSAELVREYLAKDISNLNSRLI